LISVEPAAREKDILDTIERACQALMGAIVGANQIAGPVKAGEKLPPLADREFGDGLRRRLCSNAHGPAR
jgi:hypothetical protein